MLKNSVCNNTNFSCNFKEIKWLLNKHTSLGRVLNLLFAELQEKVCKIQTFSDPKAYMIN